MGNLDEWKMELEDGDFSWVWRDGNWAEENLVDLEGGGMGVIWRELECGFDLGFGLGL